MTSKITKIEHRSPKIQSIYLEDEGRCNIALPPLSVISGVDGSYSFIGIYFQFQGNFYSNINRAFYMKSFSDAEYNRTADPLDQYFRGTHFSDSKFDPIQINESLIITSLAQWTDLTKQNPNFMKEQFSRQHAIKKPNIYFKRYENKLLDFEPIEFNSMFLSKSSGNCNAKTSPPSTRSIRTHSFSEHDTLVKLSLPEIAIVQSEDGYRCLMHTRNNTYVPLCLPNVSPFGCLCMKPTNNSNPFDYFWHSTFNSNTSDQTHLNPNLSIKSLQQWQKLTEQNPNFFQQELDPNFAESVSPILYNLRNNRLSWTLQ